MKSERKRRNSTRNFTTKFYTADKISYRWQTRVTSNKGLPYILPRALTMCVPTHRVNRSPEYNVSQNDQCQSFSQLPVYGTRQYQTSRRMRTHMEWLDPKKNNLNPNKSERKVGHTEIWINHPIESTAFINLESTIAITYCFGTNDPWAYLTETKEGTEVIK